MRFRNLKSYTLVFAFCAPLPAMAQSVIPEMPSWFLNAPADTTIMCGSGMGESKPEALAHALNRISRDIEMIRARRAEQSGVKQSIATLIPSIGPVDVLSTFAPTGQPGGERALVIEVMLKNTQIKTVTKTKGRGDQEEISHRVEVIGRASDIIAALTSIGGTFRTQETGPNYYLQACVPRSRVL